MTREEIEARNLKALENRDIADTSTNPHFVDGVDANEEYKGATGVPDTTAPTANDHLAMEDTEY